MKILDIGIVTFCKKIVARLDVCQIARAVALAWHTSTVQQSINTPYKLEWVRSDSDVLSVNNRTL